MVVNVDFDSCRLSGGMCGGALNLDLIRETLFLFFPCYFPMAFTLRLGVPFFFFFFVFLFGFREIEMVVA